MNNFLLRLFRKGFYEALIIAVLASTLPVIESMAMPTVSVVAKTTNRISPGQLQALSYTIPGSFMIAVHLENPRQEEVSILILDQFNQVVYKKELGKPATFVSKFNLKNLSNGNYTMVVKSPNHTYTKAFSLETHTKRVITLEQPTSTNVKQEAI